MADDRAISNFGDILANLKRKFEITDSKWTNDCLYELKFRTQLSIENEDYNKYCDQWLEEFSYVTDTIWVHTISNTGPKVKFRKQYQCWTYQTKEINNEILFDARRCRGTLDIKVLGGSSCVKKTNRFMRLGLNVLVKINFQHLHPVDIGQDYAFFVHWCKPLPEAPKPIPPTSERVSELVAKVFESAHFTSQKAAERAREALKRRCIQAPNSATTASAGTQTLLNGIDGLNTTQLSLTNSIQSPLTQVANNSQGEQNSDSHVYYLHQVVFDSATQTITEVVPISASDIHITPEQPVLQKIK